MKKAKTVKSFFFKDISNQDMADLLNKKNPINLKYNEELVNRVYNRYSTISKMEVIKIIAYIFQGFREFLVLGKVLNLNNLFFDTKLFFFDTGKYSRIIPYLRIPSMRVQMSTPPPLRKHDQ